MYRGVFKRIIFVFSAVILAIAFQNCGGVNFSVLPSVPTPPPEGGGGGISKVKPALAIRQTQCIICHASIQGNLVTDFGYGNNSTGEILKALPGNSRNGTGEYAFFMDPNPYGSRLFWATNYVNGKVITPRASFKQASFDDIQTGITYSKSNQNYIGYSGQVLSSSAPAGESVRTIAGYLNSILNYRTPEFVTALKTYVGNTDLSKPSDAVNNAYIREVSSVTISSPSNAELLALLGGTRSRYIKNTNGLDLAGLVDAGNHFRVDNTSGEFVCDGDLILDSILFLKNLKIRTRGGCRIYSTKSVFVESSQNSFASGRNVLSFIDDSGQNLQNLQITSSRAVLLGLGQCGSNNSISNATSPRFTTGDSVYLDYQILVNSGGPIPQDAYNCQALTHVQRIAHIDRTLINAPRVDSRFTGHFSGVIVSEFMISALGKFNYKYDLVFDRAEILPQGNIGNNIFSVEDCVDAQGVDQSRVVDTKFRSCHP